MHALLMCVHTRVYAGSTVAGFLNRDNIRLGDLEVKGQVFAEISTAHKPLRSRYIDGIVGLGFATQETGKYPVRL